MSESNNNLDLCALREKVSNIARETAKMICGAAFTVEEKSENVNIVTSNDIASQRQLIKKLSELLPNSSFFCEEEDISDLNSDYVWIIDPIDGTTNYSRGIADCAISIALAYKMQVVLGVVCSIATCDVFSATLEGGATLNGKPISVSQNGFERSILCTALSLYKKEYAKACADVIFEAYMQCNDVRRFGSCALELCYIAAGRCELYFEMRLFPWDYAAASLILSEAGGVIRSLNDEEAPLDRPTLLVAANNYENYKKLSNIVNKHIKTIPYEE